MVPKCRECEFHIIQSIGLTASCRQYHWCTHLEVQTKYLDKSSLSAKEFKTSPKWCPLRQEAADAKDR